MANTHTHMHAKKRVKMFESEPKKMLGWKMRSFIRQIEED